MGGVEVKGARCNVSWEERGSKMLLCTSSITGQRDYLASNIYMLDIFNIADRP